MHLSGGRGDFIAFIIIIITINFMRSWWHALVIATSLAIASFAVLGILINLSYDTIAAERFLVLYREFGSGARASLLLDAVNLLYNDWSCLVVGCGFTYFQYYYDYNYGFYPHNILIESFIVWGVPLTLLIIVFFLKGLFHDKRIDFIKYIGMFFAIISMKSGDVIGSWFVLGFILFYAGVGMSVSQRSRFERG